MTIAEILENDWFKKGYKPPRFDQEQDVSLDDIDAVFSDSQVRILFQLNHLYSYPVIWKIDNEIN